MNQLLIYDMYGGSWTLDLYQRLEINDLPDQMLFFFGIADQIRYPFWNEKKKIKQKEKTMIYKVI